MKNVKLKIGRLTSEFWISLVTALVGILITLGVITQDLGNKIIEIVALILGSLLTVGATSFYIWSRSRVKAQLLGASGGIATSGWQSSEFWMTIITSICSILVMLNIIGQEQANQLVQAVGSIASGIVAIVSIVVYIISRTKVKMATIVA